MIRPAARPLTGPAQMWHGQEPAVKLGRRPGKPGDRRTRTAWDGDTRRYVAIDMGPATHHGQPAVTVDLNAQRSGARTFEDPNELLNLAYELNQAAAWLSDRQREEQQ